MFKFLAGLEFWQILSLAVIIIGSILAIVFRGKITLLSGEKRLEINQDKKNNELGKHKNCPYVYDILGIISKTIEVSSRIVSIKENLLKDQMKYTDQKLLIITDLIRQAFIEGLIGYGEKNPTKVDGYNNYSILLDLLEYKLSTFFRNSFIDNHLNRFQKKDKTIDLPKFDKYKEEKIEAVESIINELFNNHYKKVSEIDREMLRQINELISPKLDQMLSEIIINGLELTTNGYNKIISLDNELKHYVKMIIGVDYNGIENK